MQTKRYVSYISRKIKEQQTEHTRAKPSTNHIRIHQPRVHFIPDETDLGNKALASSPGGQSSRYILIPGGERREVERKRASDDRYHDRYHADGTRVRWETNACGEMMPVVPDCIKPKSRLRDRTEGPAGSLWHPILSCWIIEYGTAVGTWGHFKAAEPKRINSPIADPNSGMQEDEGYCSGEKNEENATTTTSSAKPDMRPQMQATSNLTNLDATTRSKIQAARRKMFLDDLRRQAAQRDNENAIESGDDDSDVEIDAR